MANLFSIFDPAANLNLPLNWTSALIVLLILPAFYWKRANQAVFLYKTLVNKVSEEIGRTLKRLSVPGLLAIPAAFLVSIALNNFIGLFPYIFTASRHPLFTLTLALPFWLGHIILGAALTPNHILAHFVPLGTPAPLIPFIVVIEIIRSVIRPLTLAIRLAANMIAGHLLLALLGRQGFSFYPHIFSLVILSLILLLTLEVAVRLIQSYVFSVLSTLYINEVNGAEITYLKN